MKSLSRYCFFFVSAAVAAAFSNASGAQVRETVLKVADYRSPTHMITTTVTKYWMDSVTRATNGAVRFEHFPAEQLGKAKDLLNLVQGGAVDIADVSPPYNTDKLVLSAVSALPGTFSTSCEGSIAFWNLATTGLLAKNEYAPVGVRVLFVHALVPYQIYMGKSKFEKLSDLEGKRLRSSGGPMDLTVQKLGAVPIKITSPEVYESFSRGTLDGLVFPLMAIPEWKLTDIVKTATAGENFGSFMVVFAISEQRWASLSPAVQKAMLDAGDAATRHGCKLADEADTANLEALKKSGVRIVNLSAGQREELQNRLAPVAQTWAEGVDRRGKPGSETLKAFRAAVKQVQ